MRTFVLVVEPDSDSRYVYTAFLQSAGLRVAAVPDQESALRALGEERPDVIVTELLGDAGDRAANVRELRARLARRSVPVIVATAWVSAEDRSAARGADGYLTKPVHGEELLCQVRRVTARRAARPQCLGKGVTGDE